MAFTDLERTFDLTLPQSALPVCLVGYLAGDFDRYFEVDRVLGRFRGDRPRFVGDFRGDFRGDFDGDLDLDDFSGLF